MTNKFDYLFHMWNYDDLQNNILWRRWKNFIPNLPEPNGGKDHKRRKQTHVFVANGKPKILV